MQAEGDRKLRILHVIDSGGLYGAERVLLGLARKCASLGDEVVVVTLVSPDDDGDPLGDAVVACGLEHQPFLVPDGFRPGVMRQVLEFARSRRMDVIHSHGYRANIMLGLVPRRFRPCAIICTLHGWTATGRFQKLAIYERLERFVVRRFERVVAVSESIRRSLAHTVPASQLTRVNNGIDVQVAEDVRITKGSSARHDAYRVPVLLAAGRLSEEKGFDLLVEAVAQLRKQGIMVRVKIAGDGPLRESIGNSVSDLGLEEHVELLGYQKDLAPLFREADLFVLPSRSEGLPLVLLEAMAHRVPVVATPVGEVPTVLEAGQLGTLTEAVDHQSLARALKDRLARAQWETSPVTQEARNRVVTKYSLESMAAGYRGEYFEAMAAKGSSGGQATRV